MDTNGTDWMDGIYIHMSLHERGAQPFLPNHLCFQGHFTEWTKTDLEF